MDRSLDNVNQSYPARMSDGRQFTDFRANCIMNNEFSAKMNSWEYRYFLTNNAHTVASGNTQLMESVTAYNGPTTPEVPTQTIQNCTDGFCRYEQTNPTGIGLDRANTVMKQ